MYDIIGGDEATSRQITSIENTLDQWMVSVHRRWLATTLPPIAEDVAIQAADLARDGYNPVLVIFQDRMKVVSDFLVGHYLSDHFDAAAPLLVIPLHSLVNSFFEGDDIPVKPTIRPARKIHKSGSPTPVEEEFDVEGDWQVTKPKAKPKTIPKSKPNRKRKK